MTTCQHVERPAVHERRGEPELRGSVRGRSEMAGAAGAVATVIDAIVTLLAELDLHDPVAAVRGKPAVRLATSESALVVLVATVALLPGVRLKDGIAAPSTHETADGALTRERRVRAALRGRRQLPRPGFPARRLVRQGGKMDVP